MIEDLQYLIIGVEDGWIHVDAQIWAKYLKAKEVINDSQRNN